MLNDFGASAANTSCAPDLRGSADRPSIGHVNAGLEVGRVRTEGGAERGKGVAAAENPWPFSVSGPQMNRISPPPSTGCHAAAQHLNTVPVCRVNRTSRAGR
jgi:hypothetical protein